MKRTLIGIGAAFAASIVIGLGLGAFRPDLLPPWARPQAPAASQETALQCKEHGVPEKFCTLCHKELKTSLMLCKEHGNIPEDICTLCHPELQKKYAIEMCPKGHGLPEHFCYKCEPSPSASSSDALPAAVRLASPEMARDIGLETVAATNERLARTLTANAEAAYDTHRYAEVRPRVSGFLREVKSDLGQKVRRGETLAVVDSAEIGTAKARFLNTQSAAKLAQVTSERMQSLSKSGSVASRMELESLTALNEAQANLTEAEQRLKNLGYTDEEIERIARTKDTNGILTITAPIDGTVVALAAARGEAVEPTTRIFAIADTSTMWLWIDVYESDIASIADGQQMNFTISGAGAAEDAPTFAGKITWIGTEVDSMTRTTRVRAEVANPNGRLRAHQFGRAQIQTGAPHDAVVVPTDAVQRRNRQDLVFIPEADGTYRPQVVRISRLARRNAVEVIAGLTPGQKVVTTGAFLLKTETMKDALGAGCVDD
jgi:cobalt-zinc-cadmium efflux system membrane fusion protein